MYNNKLVIALKSHGKVLREFQDTVYLPFGSEYSILVKNLNTVRVQANITVDNQTVIEGLVVNPLQEVEIERFVKDRNLSAGNRLKFIERTPSVEQHRGVGIDDGLIRVEFQYEKVLLPDDFTTWYKEWEAYQRGKEEGRREAQWWPHGPIYYVQSYSTGITNTTSTSTAAVPLSSLTSSTTFNCNNSTVTSSSCLSSQNVNNVENCVGITVPGSISQQQFQLIASFPLEQEKHVMVLRLLGETERGKIVKQPVTVKTKQKCITCGHVNKATSKFCSECGTGLEIV